MRNVNSLCSSCKCKLLSWQARPFLPHKGVANKRTGHIVVTALLLTSIIALLAPALHAQNNETPSQTIADVPVLEELEITGAQQSAPQTGAVVESEHTGSRVRIDRQRLEQPGAQLGELIGNSSGVHERQTGGFGTFSAVTIRSASAAQTAVYLDGILLNSGGQGIIDLSTLEMLNLESVDLYKGSSPIQLGHAAIGGAVNLNTLSDTSEPGASVRLGVGSFSTFTAASSFRGSSKRWNWTGSASHLQSENDFTFLDENEPLVADDDAQATRRNNQVQRSSLLLKAGYEHTKHQKTDLLLQIIDRDIGVPDQQNTNTNRASFETLNSQFQLSHIANHFYGWNTRHTLYRHESTSLFDDSSSAIGVGRQVVNSDVETLGIKTYWEKFVDAGTWGFSTLGLSIDVRDEQIVQFDELQADSSDFNSGRLTTLSTFHLALANNDETWLLTPALRWQTSRRRGTTVSRSFDSAPTSQDLSEWALQIGAQQTLSRTLTLSANAGNYFRQPSFSELFGSTGLINGNPGLEPETGMNLDVGLGYKKASLALDARIFRSHRDDLILLSVDARGVGRPENIAESVVNGLEISGNWQATKQWSLEANATFQDPRNLSTFGSLRNKQLAGQPQRSFFTRVRYQQPRIAYWYEWQATEKRFIDSNNDQPFPDTSLHTIGAEIKRASWKLNASIQNIGDDTVEDFNGFPKPGRSFNVSFTIDL